MLELPWLRLEERAWTVVCPGLASFLAGEGVSAVEVVESPGSASVSSRLKPLVLKLGAGAAQLVLVAAELLLGFVQAFRGIWDSRHGGLPCS